MADTTSRSSRSLLFLLSTSTGRRSKRRAALLSAFLPALPCSARTKRFSVASPRVIRRRNSSRPPRSSSRPDARRSLSASILAPEPPRPAMPELLINALAATTGWTADAGITVETQGFADHISGYNAASVALRVASGSAGKAATLALTSQDVAPYQWISFSAVSFRRGIQGMRHLADAQYSIELATGQVFYVPISSEFTRVWIPVDGYSAVTKFKVKALHNGADFLVLSNLRATRDDFPADVLYAVKAGIEIQRDRIAPGRGIGTVTGAAGDLAVD